MTYPKSHQKYPRLALSKGFTLLELMVVMAIISILAVLETPNIMTEINQKRALTAVAETTSIMDAARSYRSQKGVWPGDATCSNALSILKGASPPYLQGVGITNKYNSPYSTSCTAQTFSLDQNAVADYDGYLASQIAGTEVVSLGTHQVRTTIGLPGSEPALEAKLSRLATGNAELNRMRTTLYLGGNDIKEINNVEAVNGSFSANVTSRTLTVQDIAQIAGALTAGSLNVSGESQFTGKAYFKQEAILGKVAVEGAKNCQVGALARDMDGVTLSCQKGIWKRTPSAKTIELTAGEVFNACIGSSGQDRHNVVSYDYPRYQTVCGSRYCATKSYAFGLVTELGAGFDYGQPSLSASNARVSVQCVN